MVFTDGSIFLLNQNGDAIDSSGNGNNGIDTGTTYSSGQTKIFPESALYDGTDDYTSIDKAGLPNSLSGFTFALWVYLNNTGKNQRIFDREDTNSFIQLGTTNFVTFRHIDIGDGITLSTTALATGSWEHLCVTWDGSNTAIYINATDTGDGEAAVGTISYAGTGDAILGARDSDKNNELDAYSQQMMHLDRALTSTEITALYNGGAGLDITPLNASGLTTRLAG